MNLLEVKGRHTENAFTRSEILFTQSLQASRQWLQYIGLYTVLKLDMNMVFTSWVSTESWCLCVSTDHNSKNVVVGTIPVKFKDSR